MSNLIDLYVEEQNQECCIISGYTEKGMQTKNPLFPIGQIVYKNESKAYPCEDHDLEICNNLYRCQHHHTILLCSKDKKDSSSICYYRFRTTKRR